MLTASFIRHKLKTNITNAEYVDTVLMEAKENSVHFYIAENTTEIKSSAFSPLQSTVHEITFLGTKITRLDGVFENCYELRSINLGILYKLTTIGCRCFKNCYHLRSIEIPASVQYINSYAFYHCANLRNVSFQENSKLRAIMKFSFEGTILTQFKIMPNVMQIDYGAFKSTKIEKFDVPENYNRLNVIDNIFYSRFRTSLILCPPYLNVSHLNITEKITKIEPYALSCKFIKKVTFPPTLKRICENAFDGSCIGEFDFSQCENLSYLDTGAFKHCSNLTELNLSMCTKILEIKARTFHGLPKLQTLIMPPNIHTLENESIIFCSNLSTIELNTTGNLTNIGFHAFACIGVHVLSFGPNVSNITLGAFSELNNLTDYYVNSENKNISTFEGVLFNKNMTTLISYPMGRNKTSYTVPDSVLKIYDYAFKGAARLVDISLPPFLQVIGTQAIAFTNCTSLRTPSTLKIIEPEAILNNVNLVFLYLDGKYTLIPSRAVVNCPKLMIIYFCDDLEYAEPGAFPGCNRIKCVTCQKSLKDTLYNAGIPWATLNRKKCPDKPITVAEAEEMFE